MKCTFLILAVMFLVFDYSWAKEKDADKLVLDGNHANSFLARTNDLWCEQVQETSDRIQIINQNVKEECCKEGCDKEEMAENIGNLDTEWARESFMTGCCH